MLQYLPLEVAKDSGCLWPQVLGLGEEEAWGTRTGLENPLGVGLNGVHFLVMMETNLEMGCIALEETQPVSKRNCGGQDVLQIPMGVS